MLPPHTQPGKLSIKVQPRQFALMGPGFSVILPFIGKCCLFCAASLPRTYLKSIFTNSLCVFYAKMFKILELYYAACVTSLWSAKNELFGRSEGRLISVHPGGRALSHPWRLRPLLPCPQSLLEGSSAEDESLWPQHTHDVGSCCINITGRSLLCSCSRSWKTD